jgi:drug/metabolite transporter (DMT)-like permease
MNLQAPARRLAEKVPGGIQGMALMLLSTMVMTGMHASVRKVGAELPPIEIAFLRQVAVLIVLTPWFFRVGFRAILPTRPIFQTIRGLISAAAVFCWFWALSLVPLAKAATLSFTATLFVVVGAMMFLGESLKFSRFAALAVGIFGVVLVVRPGFIEFEFGVALILFSSIGAAAIKIMAKSLAATDNVSSIVGFVSIVVALATFFPAALVWQWPSPQGWVWVGLIGAFSAIGQLAMVQAYKFADMGAVEPVVFVRIIWAAAIGFVVFGEVPEIWTWIGAAMIVAGTLLLGRGERGARPAARPSVAAGN